MFTLQLHEPGAAGREWQLLAGRYRIGRSIEAEIQLPDAAVSSLHCELEVSDRGVIVRDLGSSNGTFVNGRQIREARLQPGQTFQVGTSVLSLAAAAQQVIAGPSIVVAPPHQRTVSAPPLLAAPLFPSDRGALRDSEAASRSPSRKWIKLAALGTLLILAVVSVVSMAISANRVRSVRAQDIELFYRRPVRDAEAKRVAEFLAEMWGKDGALKRELARSGGTYRLLMTWPNSDLTNLPENIPSLENLAYQVSEWALKRAPVEVHLVNEQLAAVKIVKPLPEKESRYASFLRSRIGRVRLQQGRIDEAISELRQAAEILPENIQAWIILGDLYFLNKGQCREAMIAYEKVLKLRPRLQDAHVFNNLAAAYGCLNTNLAMAVQLTRKAVALEPEVWAYLQTAATIAIQSGQNRETLEALEKVFKKEPFAGLWSYVSQIAQSKVSSGLFLDFCDRVRSFAPPLELKLALADFYRAHGEPDLAQKAADEAQQEHARLGFPPKSAWLVIGPFDNPDPNGIDVVYGPEKEFDPHKEYPGKAGPVRWRANDDSRLDGRVNLHLLLDPKNHATAYALINVVSPEEKAGQLRIGSDDRVKVWLNAQTIWTSPQDRPLRMDQDVVPIRLLRGTNRLLFKVTQGSGEWELLIRITDSIGQPLPGLRYQKPA